jgi:hypothetical protein
MQDKFEQAENLYKKALTVQTKALGSKHPEVVNLLGNYANLLFRVHRDAEGEQLRAMARGATTGKWNMSGRYQAYNAGGVAPTGAAQMPASAPGYAAPQAAPAQAPAPVSHPHTAPTGASAPPEQRPNRTPQEQQSETVPLLGKVLKTVGAPPPVQKPVMPESPQVPLPPPSTEAPPTQSGIGRLMQQRKETLKNP